MKQNLYENKKPFSSQKLTLLKTWRPIYETVTGHMKYDAGTVILNSCLEFWSLIKVIILNLHSTSRMIIILTLVRLLQQSNICIIYVSDIMILVMLMIYQYNVKCNT